MIPTSIRQCSPPKWDKYTQKHLWKKGAQCKRKWNKHIFWVLAVCKVRWEMLSISLNNLFINSWGILSVSVTCSDPHKVSTKSSKFPAALQNRGYYSCLTNLKTKMWIKSSRWQQEKMLVPRFELACVWLKRAFSFHTTPHCLHCQRINTLPSVSCLFTCLLSTCFQHDNNKRKHSKKPRRHPILW